ncbi:hypothetical protein BJ508DRAFT_419541 [Ascobolus immersus RN42]|uniref:Uncharacterized protein n=1 Tax=Ascobolus immersus RN42 TaxID=1160509 RepID=A0A3N4HDE3_ASCIM|nr:hypothetical protein BJ508DRAFT_419541 [Ascobolus immersus RN42]
MIQSPTIDPVATGQQAEEEVLGDEPGRSTEQVAGASGLPGPPKRKAFRRNTGKDDRWLIVTYDEPDWSLAENSGEEEDTDSRDYVKSTRVNQQCILCLECRVTISFTGRPSGPTPGSTNFLEHFSKGKCTGRPTVQPEGDRTKPCKVCERRSRRAGLNGEPHPELGFHYSKKDMERHKHHGAERSKYTRQEVYFQISITDTLLTPHRKLGEGYVYRVLKEKGEAVVGERS